MRFVYPLKTATRNAHIELRYSLRSLARYAPGSTPVLLTDRPPVWYTGDVIRMADRGKHKRAKTTRKLDDYARSDDAPAQWVLMCDDFFLSRREEWPSIPLYHGPGLRESAAKYRTLAHKSNNIALIWDHTAHLCHRSGLGTLSFERHLPLRIVNDLWRSTPHIQTYDCPPGIQPQSLYGNWAHKHGEPIQRISDLKYWKRGHDDEDRQWGSGKTVDKYASSRPGWSIADNVAGLRSFQVAMRRRFPDPSPWEG